MLEEPPGRSWDFLEIGGEFRRCIRRLCQQQLAATDDLIQGRAYFVIQPAGIAAKGRPFVGIEEVVDDVEQMPARGMNSLQVGNEIAQVTVVRVLDEHFAIADDVIERRAQLMLQALAQYRTLCFLVTHAKKAAILPSNRGNSTGFTS